MGFKANTPKRALTPPVNPFDTAVHDFTNSDTATKAPKASDQSER
jgi:hypothetical protein